jgi:hypothetical protein
MRMAPEAIRPVVLLRDRYAGTAVRFLHDELEHLRDAREVSGLPASMDVDVVSTLPPVVAARRLVRESGTGTLIPMRVTHAVVGLALQYDHQGASEGIRITRVAK